MTRGLLGFITFWPVIGAAAGAVLAVLSLAGLIPTAWVDEAGVILWPLIAATVVLSVALSFWYLFAILGATFLSLGQKVWWVAFLVAAGWVAMPAYWVRHLRPGASGRELETF